MIFLKLFTFSLNHINQGNIYWKINNGNIHLNSI